MSQHANMFCFTYTQELKSDTIWLNICLVCVCLCLLVAVMLMVVLEEDGRLSNQTGFFTGISCWIYKWAGCQWFCGAASEVKWDLTRFSPWLHVCELSYLLLSAFFKKKKDKSNFMCFLKLSTFLLSCFASSSSYSQRHPSFSLNSISNYPTYIPFNPRHPDLEDKGPICPPFYPMAKKSKGSYVLRGHPLLHPMSSRRSPPSHLLFL